MPSSEYKGRRGGAEDVIRRISNLLPSNTVAQSLASAHGDPILAYNRKSEIWEKIENYSKFFNSDTKAKHIVFTYSLLRALERKKKYLRENEDKLGAFQKEQLSVLRQRGSIQLLASATSFCLETFIDRPIPNIFRLSFGEVSPETAIRNWNPILEITFPFCEVLLPALEGGLKNYEKVEEVKKEFRRLVEATKLANNEIIRTFSEKIIEK